MESTFVGLFFFGWDRLTKVQHLMVTWLVALGSSLSALWLLIANGWIQNPVGSEFNYETMRMEVTNFAEVIFNPVAQVKFVHTVSAGYVTGAVFVLAISSYYLLKKQDRAHSPVRCLVWRAERAGHLMMGMSCGFVYGIGFTPKLRLWRWLFSGWSAIGLMLVGVLMLWVK